MVGGPHAARHPVVRLRPHDAGLLANGGASSWCPCTLLVLGLPMRASSATSLTVVAALRQVMS